MLSLLVAGEVVDNPVKPETTRAADHVRQLRDKERLTGQAQRRRVEEARALLASDPTASWCLGTVARAVHSSPFHLAREFRAVTGESISLYLLRLRLGLALDRIAAGETEFAPLAVELGFSHHSHFSARFRSVFGTTPTQARRKLASGRLRELSTIVTAALPAAP